MTVRVGVHAAIIFRKELQYKRKATAKYCSKIRGPKIMKKVSLEEQRAGLVIHASNIVSESLHGSSTAFLQVFGTISIPHVAAMVQSRNDNDHGRAPNNFVTGRMSKKTIESKKGDYSECTATISPPELRQSLMAASREYLPKHKKNTEKWMLWQFETRQRNEQTKVETEAAKTGEGNVVALYFFDQSNSPRLWKTVKEAWEECLWVRSCRLDVVKYQLRILYIGLVIEEAHHAYSKYGYNYTADELFEHLVETAIPLYIALKRKGNFPAVASLKLSCPPNVATLEPCLSWAATFTNKHILSRWV